MVTVVSGVASSDACQACLGFKYNLKQLKGSKAGQTPFSRRGSAFPLRGLS